MEMELDRAKECALEIEALQVYADCEVEFSLHLQAWSLDDRIMQDTDHRRRPIVEILTLKTSRTFEEPMTNFCHMHAF